MTVTVSGARFDDSADVACAVGTARPARPAVGGAA